jgi:hypothetical protein
MTLTIMNKFLKLNKTTQNRILFRALGYMQQYNGRSVNTCVALATRDWLNLNYTDHEVMEG